MNRRFRAALIHLILSAAVAGAVAWLVFLLWYPAPYRVVSGGQELFLLVMFVDVTLGPLLTLTVFNPKKASPELRRDLAVVGLLQLAGLAYGLDAVAQARPVATVLEEDHRVRVIRAFDLAPEELAKAPAGLQALPWMGLWRLAVREPTAAENFEAMIAKMGESGLGVRPQFWLPAEQAPAAWAKAGRPVEELRQSLDADARTRLDAAIKKTGRPADKLRFLPILARRTDHVLLTDATDGAIVGYAQK
jgi:hypothetical protein